jgi:putative ABC transport system permease protein
MSPARLLADLRYGFRQLRLNPGFACLAILTLALGIGANTALFSVVRSVILKPLPYRDPERIVRVWMDNRRLQMREDWASYLNYQDYKRLGTTLESIAAFTEPTTNLVGDGEPERVRGVNTEASIFDVLGVTPVEGRLFTSDEEMAGKENVVVISWGLAQRRFGGVRQSEGANVLGRTLDFDGRRMTVIGIMPAGFAFPSKESEFWAPLMVSEQAKSRGGYWLQMVARLKPGVTPVQAKSEMDTVARQLEQQYPNDNAGYGIYVNPLENHVAGNVRTPLFVLLGAVGFVLLIACVNVAGLFLARAEARGREIVVRAAIGASRGRLVSQLLMEAGALAASAGAVGIAAAYAGVRGILWLAPPDLPRLDEIALDGTVLVFAVGLTTLTALTFGLWPAWRLSRVSLQEALREGGRGMSSSHAAARTRSVLLVVQCALAIMLLAGAGLLLRSLGALRGMETGFRTANVLTMRVNVSRTTHAQPPQVRQFYDQVLARVRALPGVKGAAVTSNLFLSNTPSSGTFTLEDRPPFPPSEQIEATIDSVSPGFFEMMQVRLVSGRFPGAEDRDDGPRVLAINETFANRYWPNQDPVGRRMVFGTPGERNPWMTIVGVVGDMRRRGLHQGARLETFFSSTQNAGRNMQLLVASDGDPIALSPSVRAAIRALDPSSPLTALSTVEAQIGESLAIRRFQAWLLALFSMLAVILSAVGIFGLMAQVVVRRTPEIGVRLALGASPWDVLALVVRQGVGLAAAGTMLGIAGALALARGLQSLLFGVGAADPLSYAGAALVMAVSVILACALPAWRASRVDPTVALRGDG